MTTSPYRQSDYETNADVTNRHLHVTSGTEDFKVSTTTQDGPSVDSFGRQRVSDTGQRLDVEFIYDLQEEFFDDITTNGSIVHNANTRDLTLSLSDTAASSSAEMRSHPVPYTPGNSQLVEDTGVLDLAGIGSGEVEVFLKSKISGTTTDIETVAQSEWTNLSTGLDWSKSHIFVMDFQSLKVGRIRYLINTGGINTPVAEITNDNLRDSGYWQLPSLSVYFKLYNTATHTISEIGYGSPDNAIGFRHKIPLNANATMKAICCTVKSEGGLDLQDLQGLPRSADMGETTKLVGTTLIPLLSIRPKSTFKTFDNMAIALPKAYSLATDNPVRVVVMHDVTLTGASWTDVNTNDSMMEYDVSATALSGGHKISSEYISTIKNANKAEKSLLGKTVMWNRRNSDTGILTIAAIRTSTTSADVLASLNWEEIR